MKNIIVVSVESGSIAEEAGVEVGDRLVSVNQTVIQDVFDYRFQISMTELLLEIEKPDGEIWEIEIEKDEYEDLGIDFEDGLLDDSKSCTNNCIFCFIDQLPKGMRETVYFKDDDTRLSFLSGNYVTLTNVKNEDIDRIIRYRMSPINISVHTTDPELRKFMLGNRFAGDILEKIKRLVDGEININCQIVLCRDVNDGLHLDKTLTELSQFVPMLESVSVVPVGITKHRDGLAPLKAFDKESALTLLLQLSKHQKKFKESFGKNLVYAADEFYVLSESEIPNCDHYEGFPQIENGVGMLASFHQEFKEVFEMIKEKQENKLTRAIEMKKNTNFIRFAIATGACAFQFISKLVKEVDLAFGTETQVFCVRNDFFGENVTVSGLLTGQDIAKQLEGKNNFDELVISRNMLRAGEETFLDDWDVEKLEKHLGKKVNVVDNNGGDLIKILLGI